MHLHPGTDRNGSEWQVCARKQEAGSPSCVADAQTEAGSSLVGSLMEEAHAEAPQKALSPDDKSESDTRDGVHLGAPETALLGEQISQLNGERSCHTPITTSLRLQNDREFTLPRHYCWWSE